MTNETSETEAVTAEGRGRIWRDWKAREDPKAPEKENEATRTILQKDEVTREE